MSTTCESCLMPLHKDPEKSGSNRYCSYCFRNGELCYKGSDRKEFQRICYEKMVEHGTNPLLARFYVFLIRFAPRWKKN